MIVNRNDDDEMMNNSAVPAQADASVEDTTPAQRSTYDTNAAKPQFQLSSPVASQATAQEPAPQKKVKTTITTTSGKTYTLSSDQRAWIEDRYRQSWADTYGYDDNDQAAKANGQMSAKVRSTYGNSNVDNKLAQMGLPSEKNLEKYLKEYDRWHTGGIEDYFGDVSSEAFTGMKDFYKKGWEYEDTAEDQYRKNHNMMPSKLESRYGDTEIDEQLRAAGLPPIQDFDEYAGKYNNYSGIDTLYRNAAGQFTRMRLTKDVNGDFVQNDNKSYTVKDPETGETKTMTGKKWYAKAFYDELGRTDEKGNMVYGKLLPLMKKSAAEDIVEDYIDPTKSYVEQRDADFMALGKADKDSADFENHQAFSYDDFVKNYDKYYEDYWKDLKLSTGQSVAEAMEASDIARDAERARQFYDIDNKWFDGKKGVMDFIAKYQQTYPENSYEQMFTDMYNNGVSDEVVNKTMRALSNGRAKNKAEDGNSGFYDITNAYIRAKKKSGIMDITSYDPHDYEPKPKVDEEDAKYKTTGLSKEDYDKFQKEADLFADASMKRDENDEETIATAKDAIKNGLALFYDDEGMGTLGDVDSVIKVLQGIEDQDWNNPIAMRLALQDYGFHSDGTMSGPAADLTSGWSHEDKARLAIALGNIAYSTVALDEDWKETLEGAPDARLRPDSKLDRQKFSYYLQWAQGQIQAGRLTEMQAYNILAGKGFQNELDEYMPEAWHEAVFASTILPQSIAQRGGAAMAVWEEMTPEAQREYAAEEWKNLSDKEKAEMFGDGWWETNPAIHRTFGQALGQQFGAVIPTLAVDLFAGGVEATDALFANISGRPEMWDFTKDVMSAQDFVHSYGSVYDRTNGAQIASIASDAAGEILKMYLLGSIGAKIGAGVEATKWGGVIAKAAGGSTPVVKQTAGLFLDMVRSSPFMVSAFSGNYAKAKSYGATNAEATRFGVVTGLLEGLWEGCNFDKLWGRVIGGDKFAKMLINGGKTFKESSVVAMARAANMIVSGFSEWTEESLGYVGETLWITNSRWGKGKEDWDINDYWAQAGMGFLTGLIGAGISSGSINRQSILYDYWSTNQEVASHIVDTAVADKVFNEVATDAERDQWRNGDIRVLSQDEWAGLMVRLDTLNRQQDAEAAKGEYKSRVDEANKKYQAVKDIEDSLRAEMASLDPNDPENAKKIADLNDKIIDAAKASSAASLVREDSIRKAEVNMDERIEQEHNEREKINQLVREHFAALYLQNEKAIVRRDYNAIRNNVARDRQNGAKVSPDTNTAENAQPDANVEVKNQPWWSKQSEAETNPARPFSEADEKQVIETAKKMRYKGKITFVDDPDASWEGQIHLKSGDIEINRAKLTSRDAQNIAENPAMWVMEHELFHYMWNRGGSITDEIRSTVREMYKKHPGLARGNADANYDKFLDSIMAKRNEQGLAVNDRMSAEEEVIADFFRNYAFRSEAAIRALCETNGNLGQQILSWLRYKIDDMKLRRSKESWARDILNVEWQYALALREAGRRPYNEARAKNNGASDTAYSASKAAKYDWSQPLEKIYNDFGKAIPYDQQIVVGGVKGALQKIGFSRLPIFMNPSHMRYVTDDDAYLRANPNKKSDENYNHERLSHAFDEKNFVKLTQELEDPVAIVMYSNDRDKTVNVLTADMFAKNGERAVVSLYLDSDAHINGTQTEGYGIKTLFGKSDYWGMLKKAFEMDSENNPQILYINFDKLRSALSEDSSISNNKIYEDVFELARGKEKALETSKKDGLSSPYQFESGAYSRSLPDAGYRVNTNSQTDTTQFKKWFGDSVAKSSDGTPLEYWRTTSGEYTDDEAASDGTGKYYLSTKKPYDGDLWLLKIEHGGLAEVAKELSTQGFDSFYSKDKDGHDHYIVFRKAQAKAAEDKNIGLFDRSNKNPLYSSAENLTDETLSEYAGVANPATGVTAEEDEAYMRAALAGDTETAKRMVDELAERLRGDHLYHGETRPVGSYTEINWDDFTNEQMFASPEERGAESYAGDNRFVKPLRYPNEAKILADYVNTVNGEMGFDYSVEPVDGTNWKLVDNKTGDVIEPSATAIEIADAVTLAANNAENKNGDIGLPPEIENPFSGGIMELYYFPERVARHRGYRQSYENVLGDNVIPSNYIIYDDITLKTDNETGEAELVATTSDGSTTSVRGDSADEVFEKMFGPESNVYDFFMDTYEFDTDDDGNVVSFVREVPVSPKKQKVFKFENHMFDGMKTDDVGVEDARKGYDQTVITNIFDGGDVLASGMAGAEVPPGDIAILRNENRIKSADAITYDDDGNIIPLSQRFDLLRNDLRYSGGLDIDQILNDITNNNNSSDVDAELDERIRQYGAKQQGRNPRARDVRVPERANAQRRYSDFLRSLVESDKIGNDQIEAIKRKIVEEDWLSYIPKTNEESMAEARAYIADRQPLEAQQDFHDMVTSGKLSAKTNALGIQLMADAAERGDIESVLNIANDLQIAATEAGQSAQIFNVLKELKGVGSAWYMNGLIKKLNTKYADRIQAGKMNPITVPVELMETLSKARTVSEIAEAEDAVAKEIARQLPLTWDARLSNWRYFSMLANPTTHFRNLTGNVLMGGLNKAKDVVATGLEKALNVDEDQRAHAVLTSADKSMWGGWADESYNEQARNLSGGGKLSFKTFVEQNMRSFDTKWVNALAQFNFKALEKEDVWFIKPAYKNALMQYMKAQGFTLNEKGQAGKIDAKGKFVEMTNAQKSAAVEWASQQAWKATFRDASSLATLLNKVSKENAVSRLLVEGVMPFKKTPINIAKRGIEYSPAGIIMGITQLLTKVKQGKMSAAQAIDNLASGITGTALMALGVFLAKAGIIRAGGEDKKKYETYLEDTGDQTYAVKFGDASINMSAIAPATIPLFMGVALDEMIQRSGEDVDLSTITDVLAGTLNPFMEMSFMASLNSALKNYNNNGIGGALGGTIMTAAQNYFSQYLPTFGGKIAQFADPTLRSTKSDATSPVGGNMDYYGRSLLKKIPGATTVLQPDVDVWGRTTSKDTFGEWALDFANKFILPTNIKVTNRDEVDNELIRVVESTGVTDFLPSDGNKYFTIKGERYNMNAKQYAQFSQERGQAAYAAIKEVMASPSYINATDEAKADMLNKAKEAAYKIVNNIWKEKLLSMGK